MPGCLAFRSKGQFLFTCLLAMAFAQLPFEYKLLVCSTNSSPSGLLQDLSFSIRGNSVFISLPLIYMPGKPSHNFLQLLPLIYLLQMHLAGSPPPGHFLGPARADMSQPTVSLQTLMWLSLLNSQWTYKVSTPSEYSSYPDLFLTTPLSLPVHGPWQAHTISLLQSIFSKGVENWGFPFKPEILGCL